MHPNTQCSTIYNGQDMRRQSKCPSKEKGIKEDVVHIHCTYTMEYYSAIKEQHNAIQSNIETPRIVLSETSQT